jgi:hypothetical protein
MEVNHPKKMKQIMFDNLKDRIETVEATSPTVHLLRRYQAKNLNSNSRGFGDVISAIVGAVIALVIFAALIDVVLISLNNAAQNKTLVANSQWAQTLSLLYVVGLMAVVVGVAIAAVFVMKSLKE